MIVVSSRVQVPLRELRFHYSTSRGPGGQNVNRRSTRAELRWRVTHSPALPDDVRERFLARFRRRVSSEGWLLITSQRFRDQGRNSADCLEKLRAMLAEVDAPPRRRRPTRPTRSARARQRAAKQRRSALKRSRARPEPGENGV
ncbi:MAG: alternative ribosome rescue aminoacyl-tRNA hydrolase ArfB [Myxococcota bacterium]